jgi:KUP system potassium uptake protein
MPSSNSENDSSGEYKGEFPSPRLNKKVIFLAIASIGVVFGDIGTSPLYAIKACFHGKHVIAPSAMNVLGVLSLIF